MIIYYRKITFGWLMATAPVPILFFAVGYFCFKSVRLPSDWNSIHIIFLVFIAAIYLSFLWFCISNLWVSISHQFRDKIVTKYSILWFSWGHTRDRSDIKDSKIVETGGSPFGSRCYVLRILFKDGTTESVCMSNDITSLQQIQRQLELDTDSIADPHD